MYCLKYCFTVTNQRQIAPNHRSLLANKGDPSTDILANNRNFYKTIFRNPLITCLYFITAYLASRTTGRTSAHKANTAYLLPTKKCMEKSKTRLDRLLYVRATPLILSPAKLILVNISSFNSSKFHNLSFTKIILALDSQF